MKYEYHPGPSDVESRKTLNEKVLYLIDRGTAAQAGITGEDIYNAYTGDGGLHGLERKDYGDYHSYCEAKKEIENGQFFTPPDLCQLVASALKPAPFDLVADLTCGKGSFFNFFPVESNLYGCEIDAKAYKVARFLFPTANITPGDIRTYQPGLRFDCVVGNPPFNLRWWAGEGKEILSQLYYCRKAAELLKPLGILALIVPRSFLADDFQDKAMIKEMERQFSFLGQVGLPDDAFSDLGVESFSTKLQLWQKKSEVKGWTPHRYTTKLAWSLSCGFDPAAEAERIYEQMLMLPKADLEKNKSHVLLELAKEHSASKEFAYQTQKLLYQIMVHPATREQYAKCCEYLHRFYTQTMPKGMDYKEWQRIRLTETKVLSYLRRALRRQNQKPERDVIALIKQNDSFVYKAYSAKARGNLAGDMKIPVPIYQAVLDNEPERFPGFERLLCRKRREYDNQSQSFEDMAEDPVIGKWLKEFTLWDAENEEYIYLNDVQCRDINRMLQKRYGMLQWEQGSGKTLAAIATGLYRMQNQGLHSTWVVSSAISIRNNWDVVLPNYGLSYVFVEKLEDLAHIKPGDFVLITLNRLGMLQRHIKRWVKRHHQHIMLVLDESDEISNPNSVRAKASLSCFRRCRIK